MSLTECVYDTKLPRSVLKKLPRLLPSFYSADDLMKELGITRKKLEALFKWGAPHRVDTEGETWVTGEDFAYWVEALERLRNCELMDDQYAYCERCNKVVSLENSQTIPLDSRCGRARGECELCGETVTKGVRLG